MYILLSHEIEVYSIFLLKISECTASVCCFSGYKLLENSGTILCDQIPIRREKFVDDRNISEIHDSVRNEDVTRELQKLMYFLNLVLRDAII